MICQLVLISFKLETFDPENHTEELQEVNGVKCWDSHKVVKLELDFLKDHYMILSLSTGLFKLDEKKEKIVVAIVGDVKGGEFWFFLSKPNEVYSSRLIGFKSNSLIPGC